jgi:hypothetical protein
MILDANTVAKLIRHTSERIKKKNKSVAIEPTKSILNMLEELAISFDQVTVQAQEEKRAREEKPTPT